MTSRRWTCLTGAAVLMAAAWHTAQTVAQTPAVPCQVRDPDSHFAYKMLIASEQQYAHKIRGVLCEEAASGKWTVPVAAAFMDAWIMWYAVCEKGAADDAFIERWRDVPAYQAVAGVNREFCRRTRYESVVRDVRWMRNEIFCQTTRYTADPAGWRGWFKPTTKSWQRLEALAASLCEDLRKERISLANALYQWEQEELWTSEHLPGEMGKAAAAAPLGLLSNAVELLAKVASLGK